MHGRLGIFGGPLHKHTCVTHTLKRAGAYLALMGVTTSMMACANLSPAQAQQTLQANREAQQLQIEQALRPLQTELQQLREVEIETRKLRIEELERQRQALRQRQLLPSDVQLLEPQREVLALSLTVARSNSLVAELRTAEQELHAQLDAMRIRGEWFDVDAQTAEEMLLRLAAQER